jgi:hypothetical protein
MVPCSVPAVQSTFHPDPTLAPGATPANFLTETNGGTRPAMQEEHD